LRSNSSTCQGQQTSKLNETDGKEKERNLVHAKEKTDETYSSLCSVVLSDLVLMPAPELRPSYKNFKKIKTQLKMKATGSAAMYPLDRFPWEDEKNLCEGPTKETLSKELLLKDLKDGGLCDEWKNAMCIVAKNYKLAPKAVSPRFKEPAFSSTGISTLKRLEKLMGPMKDCKDIGHH
jgi:hypothetical protein